MELETLLPYLPSSHLSFRLQRCVWRGLQRSAPDPIYTNSKAPRSWMAGENKVKIRDPHKPLLIVTSDQRGWVPLCANVETNCMSIQSALRRNAALHFDKGGKCLLQLPLLLGLETTTLPLPHLIIHGRRTGLLGFRAGLDWDSGQI
jgi:hypothetical protein